MIDYREMRLEIEAEEPRNKIVMPNPPVGVNGTNRYVHNWTGINGATWNASTNRVEIPAATAAGTRVAESPTFACVPGGPISASMTLTQSNNQAASLVLVGYTSGGALVGDLAVGSTVTGGTTGAFYVNAQATAPDTCTQFRVVIVRQNTGTTSPNLGVPPLEQFVNSGPTVYAEWPTRTNTTLTAENGSYRLSPGSSRSLCGNTYPVTAGDWLGAAVTSTSPANLFVEWVDGPGGSVSTGAATGTRTVLTQVPSGVTGARLRVNVNGTVAANLTDVILVSHPQYEYARRTTPAESARPNNLITNPSGELGGVGWSAPGSAYMVKNGSWLRFIPNFSTTTYFYSDMRAVTPGKWLGASWSIKSADPWRQRIEFLDSSGALLASGTPTSFWRLSTSMISGYTEAFYADPVQVPAGTVYARIRFDMYGSLDQANIGGTGQGSIALTDLRYVTLSEHATSAEAVALPYADPGAKWRDWLSPATDLKISRDDLDTGRLTATLRHELLDPATTTEIETGRAIRFLLQGEPVFTGTIDTVSALYRPEGGLPEVSLTAVDGNARLASASRPDAVGTVAATPALVEGTGVPWKVNGSSDQIGNYTRVAYNDNATALDGIALMRDTTGAIVYLDRFGWLVANDRPGTVTPVASIGETVYMRPEISFSTDDLVNEVRVTVQEIDAAGETVERPGGTFRLDSSVARYGVYSRDYTVTPVSSTPAALKAWADALLAANGTPEVSINEVTIPIKNLTFKPYALLDLYAPVTVSNTARGISKVRRIKSIAHDVSPKGWFMTVTFTGTDSRAQAQVTPSPPQDAGQLQRVDISSLISWGTGTVTIFRDGPWRHLRGNVNGTLPTGSTDFLNALDTADRPSAVEFGSSYLAGGYSGTMFVYPDGRMTFRNDTGASRTGNQQFTIVYAAK